MDSSTINAISLDNTQVRNLRNPGQTFNEAWITWDEPSDPSYLVDYEITCPGREPVRTLAREYTAMGLIPDVEYLFQVRPLRSQGNPALPVSISVVTQDQVPPTRPQRLKITSSTPGNATLSWRASEDNMGVTGYEVRRNEYAWLPCNGTDYPIADLNADETFEVRAIDAAGNRSLKAFIAYSKDATAPSKPTDFRATFVSHNLAILDWTAATDNVGVTRHQIYRDDEWLDNIDSTEPYIRYMAIDLASSTDYVFKVRALDAASNAGDFAYLPVRTSGSDTTPPSTPTNFRASAITSSSAVLEWTRSEDNVAVTGYQVYRNGTQIDKVDETLYSVTGLSSSTTYSFEVRAMDAAGNRSEPASVEVTTTVGNGPTHLEFHRLSPRSGTIQWEPPIESGGVTGYQLSRDGRVLGEIPETYFMFGDLTPGTTHFFEVRAIRNGQYSDPASISG